MPMRDGKLVLKGEGRLINRPTKTGKQVYDKFFIYVPTEVARDSAFPFKLGDLLRIEVDPKRKELGVR
ncbi:hypothetical protein ES706_01206 [subsurface metagenome]|nr:hypothetical protein [Hadesarchaea archaeon]